MPEMPEAVGIEAMKAKTEEWFSSIEEFHDSTISDSQVSGNFFSVAFTVDATFKDRGRVSLNEIGVYQVENGKVIKEDFFF